MSAKHTPGKLFVNGAEAWDVSLNIDGKNGPTICRLDNKGNWFPTEQAGTTRGRSQNQMLADAARLALCWNTHDQLLEALEEAVASGMVPVSSAAEGGAPAYSRVIRAADQIRAAIKAAKGEA